MVGLYIVTNENIFCPENDAYGNFLVIFADNPKNKKKVFQNEKKCSKLR